MIFFAPSGQLNQNKRLPFFNFISKWWLDAEQNSFPHLISSLHFLSNFDRLRLRWRRRRQRRRRWRRRRRRLWRRWRRRRRQRWLGWSTAGGGKSECNFLSDLPRVCPKGFVHVRGVGREPPIRKREFFLSQLVGTTNCRAERRRESLREHSMNHSLECINVILQFKWYKK